MDVYASSIEKLYDKITVHTGLYFEIPKGYEMQLRPRSNLVKYRYIMLDSPATIDCDYRGELLIVFRKLDGGPADDFPYKVGERCAQFNIHKIDKIKFIQVNNINKLSKTDRGNGGFGSTGK